jgi:hypothetical protein
MTNALRNESCEQRIDNELRGTLADLRARWDAYCAGKEEDGETLAEYGLSFDYVEPGTFTDQREGYFRYQLSWGGPSEEFRFFVNPDLSCHRVEYWFLDWFDGAHRALAGDDLTFLLRLWDWFNESGSAQYALNESRA